MSKREAADAALFAAAQEIPADALHAVCTIKAARVTMSTRNKNVVGDRDMLAELTRVGRERFGERFACRPGRRLALTGNGCLKVSSRS